MVEVSAKLRYYRVAPRKVRLVADLIRGKDINRAIDSLRFSDKKSADELIKLLNSALSNARHNAKLSENAKLYVKEIRVDGGPAYKRFKPVWRGMAHPFKRRTSHITLVLSERDENIKSDKKIKK